MAAIERLDNFSPPLICGRRRELFVLGRLVAVLVIEREEAVELHHRAGGAQIENAAADLGFDIDRGALELGGFHLACHRAQPDQLVKPRLIGIEMRFDVTRPPRDVGRTDRFVRFLGVLGLGLVGARRSRHIVAAVIARDDFAHRGNRLVGDLHAVGAHIGDEADGLAADIDALIEPLRHPHRMRRREAELAARFLLQRRGGEGGVGVPLHRLGFHRRDCEGRGFQILLEAFGVRAGADVEALQLLAVGADEARFEGFVARRRQRRQQRPIFLADEFLDVELAVGDEAQRHRLHAAGRARARKLAPQHRRQREADEIIERAPRQIGVDQRLVDGARMLHRLRHRLFGDGVEHHALDRLRLERLLFLEHLQHVPGDRFAFAVRVGGEDELVGIFDGAGDIVQPLRRLGINLPEHAEIVVGIDGTALRRQIAHMAKRGHHLVVLAQIFIDCLRLGRRFHQNKIHV